MEQVLDHEEQGPETRTVSIIKPSLINRIKSSMIDFIVLVLLMYVASIVLDGMSIKSGLARGIAMILILLYEPVLVSINRTIGQKIIGIRVRKYSDLEASNSKSSINILSSIIRYIVKILLGWLSLLTIHSDDYGRAIHDKLGNSVMTVELN